MAFKGEELFTPSPADLFLFFFLSCFHAGGEERHTFICSFNVDLLFMSGCVLVNITEEST